MPHLFAVELSDAWPGLLGTGGVGMILAWYLWYTVTKVLPDKEAKFFAALSEQDKIHAVERANLVADLKEIVSKFQLEMEKQRLHCAQEIANSDARWEGWVKAQFGHPRPQPKPSTPRPGESGIIQP